MRHESSQTTGRGERGGTAFNNVSHGVAIAIFVVGCAYLFGGENPSELEETFDGMEVRYTPLQGYIKRANLPASISGSGI